MPPTKFVMDENGMRRNVAAIRRVEGMPITEPPPKQSFPGSGTRENWIPSINAGEDSLPPYSFCRLDTGVQFSGYYRPHLRSPSTTFGRIHGVTGNWTAAGGRPCAVMATCELGIFKYDPAGTPAFGETWGAKPGATEIYKGYPGDVEIVGIWDSGKKLALGILNPIAKLLIKAVGAQTAGTLSTGDYKIWSGGISGGADSGYTTLPDITLQTDLANNDYAIAHWCNGKWIVPKGGTGGSGSSILRGTLTADCAVGSATAAVSDVGTIDNPCGYGGASGSAVHYCDVDGTMEVIGIAIVSIDLVKNVDDTGPKVIQTKVPAGVHAVSTEGTASDIWDWYNCTEEE